LNVRGVIGRDRARTAKQGREIVGEKGEKHSGEGGEGR
jgi:hypothetical protein